MNEPQKKPSYYEFFGLPNFEEDPKKIKAAYRTMALKHHPDRKGGSHDMMRQVNEIYEVITTKKKEYDHHLKIKLGMIARNPLPGVFLNFTYHSYRSGSSSTYSQSGYSFY